MTAQATTSQVFKHYDHPAYTVPVMAAAGINVAGASAVIGAKMAAYTAMKIKSVIMSPLIATTAAGSTPLLYAVSQGTATATATLTALTSGSVTPVVTCLATAISLAQGDVFWITAGTDATAVVAATFELLPNSGANVSPQAT
jgi:hypothetical protein